MTDHKFMNLPSLSDEQYRLVDKMTQIYKPETLAKLHGKDGHKLWQATVNEVIAQLGKGSGKNFCSTIAVARVVYLLLCLKDPAEYYGKPSGDTIDILNVAINADQAKNIFFDPFKQRIQRCEWFEDKFTTKSGELHFDKSVRCFSGHSEREGWEGYNLILAILDEIAGFAQNTTTDSQSTKTASATYQMYRASVQSRFPQVGKTVLLSFPRFKGDFIQQRYEEAVGEKHTVYKTHKFKLHEDMADGVKENEFDVTWEEDRIVSYREPNVYAVKRPTWVINPTTKIEFLKNDFYRDPVDALSRFACMPPDSVDAFFKDKEKVQAAFPARPVPFDDGWRFADWFKPDESKQYFLHVDLAYKHDRAAVSMAHVDEWVNVRYGKEWSSVEPVVKIDSVRWWTPKSDKNVDFSEIKNYILSVRRRGFNVGLVTFDRWQSINMMEELKAFGLESESLSVGKRHYEDLQLLISESRLRGYHIDILLDELLSLRIIKGDKVDHPRKGSNDLADAVCGAAFNAVAHTSRNFDKEIDVRYLEPAKPTLPQTPPTPQKATGAPSPELQDWLEKMRVV